MDKFRVCLVSVLRSLINEKSRADAIKNLINYLATFDENFKDQFNNLHLLKSSIVPENSHTFTGLDPERWKVTLTQIKLPS